MLNSPFAMLKFAALFFLLFQSGAAQITSPTNGDMLRGSVEIAGIIETPEFSLAELAFAYGSDASDPSLSWFTLQTFSQPPADSTLTIWDTTTITDGTYSLRLRVFLADGSLQEVYVTGLQVRNDAPPPTETPAPTQVIPPTDAPPTLIPPVTAPPVLIFPTPTALPANPASLQMADLRLAFIRAILFALILFAAVYLLLYLRRDH